MNIYEANMFDSRNLNLRLFIDAMKLDKQLTGSYNDLNLKCFKVAIKMQITKFLDLFEKLNT